MYKWSLSNSEVDVKMIQGFQKCENNVPEQLQQAREELYAWKKKVDLVEKEKSDCICAKLDVDEKKKEVMCNLVKLHTEHEQLQAELTKQKNIFEANFAAKKDENVQLKVKLDDLEKLHKQKLDECFYLKDQARIKTSFPDVNSKFTKLEESVPTEEEGEEFLNISCRYTVEPNVSLSLRPGQVIITFEEEQVAEKILKISKHQINLEPGKLDVKVEPVTLSSATKFDVCVDISRKKINVSDIPQILSDEQMKDKLEISFSKPSLGGGEVQDVKYDTTAGTAVITFLEKGVAQRVAAKRHYPLVVQERIIKLKVQPYMTYHLEKFQTFNGISRQTVLLSDIRSDMDQEELQDKLEIHFQKPSNHGGEVESIKYIPKGQYAVAYFEELPGKESD
uniref:N-myc-interactor n=1 Tax=Callorhinchus milii TaxID=7868 RepID=V9KQT9_CALMI